MLLGLEGSTAVSVSIAAERLEVSQHHLAKVVQALAHAGVVETVRGRGGGVRLVPDADEFTVGSIVRALEPMTLVECFDSERSRCGLQPACRLAPMLDRAVEAFLASLDAHTLGELWSRPRRLRVLLG